MKNTHDSIVKTSIFILAITIISRVLGFVRETVVAAVFGVGAVTDAYAVAVQIIGTAAMLTSIYLTQLFVPTYVRAKEKDGESKAMGVANNALGVSIVVNFVLMGVLYVVSPLIIGLTGFNEEEIPLALTATNIMLLQLPLLAFVNLFLGFMTARKSFFGVNAIGIPMSLAFIVAVLVFGTDSGVVGITVAALLSVVGQVVLALFWIRKEGYRHKISVKFGTPELRSDMNLLMPAFFAGGIFNLKTWVDTLIATHLAEGSAAAIGFASRLFGLVSGLLILPFAGMAFSYMSEAAAKNDTKQMMNILWKSIRIILFIVVPIVVITIPFSFDVVSIVFERGEFTPDATIMTGTALLWYMPALLGQVVFTFLMRLYYGLQDTKTPMICSIISISVNIGLSIWMSQTMGIGGLALATTIGTILSAILLLLFLRRKVGVLGFGETAKNLFKMTICAVPCVLVVLGARYLSAEQHEIIRFIISTIAGGVAYLGAAFLLRVIVVIDIIHLVKERVTNKKQG